MSKRFWYYFSGITIFFVVSLVITIVLSKNYNNDESYSQLENDSEIVTKPEESTTEAINLPKNDSEQNIKKLLNLKVDDIKKVFGNTKNFEFENINSEKTLGSFNFENSPLYIEIFHNDENFVEEVNFYIYINSKIIEKNLLNGNEELAMWHLSTIMLLSNSISKDEGFENKISRWIAQAIDSIDKSDIKKTYSKNFKDKNIIVTKNDIKGNFYIIKVKSI